MKFVILSVLTLILLLYLFKAVQSTVSRQKRSNWFIVAGIFLLLIVSWFRDASELLVFTIWIVGLATTFYYYVKFKHHLLFFLLILYLLTLGSLYGTFDQFTLLGSLLTQLLLVVTLHTHRLQRATSHWLHGYVVMSTVGMFAYSDAITGLFFLASIGCLLLAQESKTSTRVKTHKLLFGTFAICSFCYFVVVFRWVHVDKHCCRA